jgi:hypothetical protein
MSLLDNLPHTCDLFRTGVVADDTGSGDHEQVDATAYIADEPCWVQPASAAEIIHFQRRDQIVTHKVYFNRDPGVRLTDKLDVTSGPYDGSRLTIRTHADSGAGLGLLWKVMAEIDREG